MYPSSSVFLAGLGIFIDKNRKNPIFIETSNYLEFRGLSNLLGLQVII